jgi:hypothetical protein
MGWDQGLRRMRTPRRGSQSLVCFHRTASKVTLKTETVIEENTKYGGPHKRNIARPARQCC